MQLNNTIFLILSAAILALAAPQFVGNMPTTSPLTTTSGLGPAYPVEGVSNILPSLASNGTNINLEARGYPARRVRYCQHLNGRGACLNQDLDNKRCYNFLGWWDNQVSSIYINPGLKCSIYAKKTCKGRKVEFKAPGITDLQSVGINDQASSIYCSH